MKNAPEPMIYCSLPGLVLQLLFFFGAHIVFCSKTNASEVRLLFAGFAS